MVLGYGESAPKKGGVGYENMDDVKWDSIVIETNEYLETDAIDGALKQVVQLHLQVGQDNPNERDAAANALKALLKGRDGSPFGRKGAKSAIPTSVRVVIDRICGVVEEAAVSYYNHDGIMAALCLRHAKSGGGQYDDAGEYAKAQAKKARTLLSKMFKEQSWDGSDESLLSSESSEE